MIWERDAVSAGIARERESTCHSHVIAVLGPNDSHHFAKSVLVIAMVHTSIKSSFYCLTCLYLLAYRVQLEYTTRLAVCAETH